MPMYKIEYKIEEEGILLNHSRYYHAKNESTAREMLEETWREGSLTGYEHPKEMRVTEIAAKQIKQEVKLS